MGIKWRDFQFPKKLDCDESTYTDTYGKFQAAPFERGYGVTLGNSLRRVLLSSIEGSAVTAIKISGVMVYSITIKSRTNPTSIIFYDQSLWIGWCGCVCYSVNILRFFRKNTCQ
jgi:hypothetical protein